MSMPQNQHNSLEGPSNLHTKSSLQNDTKISFYKVQRLWYLVLVFFNSKKYNEASSQPTRVLPCQKGTHTNILFFLSVLPFIYF